MHRPIHYLSSESKRACVTNTVEADTALKKDQWQTTALYLSALEKAEQAIAGYCTQRSALTAFIAVAREQKRLLPSPDGPGLSTVDDLMQEFCQAPIAINRDVN